MEINKASPDASAGVPNVDPCLMENGDDNIHECFRCCVCLDLFYKPLVLACGHIACFWCVHRAMSVFQQSYCPICRHPYNHFPGICEVLHFLLLKVEPVAYKRREMQVLEEEKKEDCFSPEIDDPLTTKGSLTIKESDHPVCSPCSIKHYQADACSPKKRNLGEAANPIVCSSFPHDQMLNFPVKSYPVSSGTNANETLEENYSPENDMVNGMCKISASDALCAACKKMLFRPVVLNCGHVYCEYCLDIPVDGILTCQVCESLHPGGLPKVCLVLNQFLEEKFPKEYASRKEVLHVKETHCKKDGPSARATKSEDAKSSPFPMRMNFLWWREHGSSVHVGVGCDSCGMCPIIGERYKCMDCPEKIGFDLCGNCYKTCSKLPGRFNQKHTSDHKFKLIQLPAAEETGAPILSDDATGDAEDSDSTT